MESITRRALTAVTEGTGVILEKALAFVPVDTGELRDSIGSVVELHGLVVNGTIFAGAEHAIFVEFGSGLRGAASDHGALPTTGIPITDAFVYNYRDPNWQGYPARPFMRNALDYSRAEVLQAFRGQGFKV